jgi:hypothetical protein
MKYYMTKLETLKEKYRKAYGKSARGRKANDIEWLKQKIKEAKSPFKETKKKSDTPTTKKKSDTPTTKKKSDTPTTEKKSDTPTTKKKSDTPTTKKKPVSSTPEKINMIKSDLVTKHNTESLPSDDILMLRLAALREDSSAKRKLRKIRKRTKKMRKQEKEIAKDKGDVFIQGHGWTHLKDVK